MTKPARARATKTPASPAPPPTDFKAWKAEADAILVAKSIRPSDMRHKEWVKAFTSGATPERAADLATTYSHNAKVTATRKRR